MKEIISVFIDMIDVYIDVIGVSELTFIYSCADERWASGIRFREL